MKLTIYSQVKILKSQRVVKRFLLVLVLVLQVRGSNFALMSESLDCHGQTVSFLEGKYVQAVRQALHVFGLFILRHSYKVTLAGLYFAALVHVNLWNAGYSEWKLRMKLYIL